LVRVLWVYNTLGMDFTEAGTISWENGDAKKELDFIDSILSEIVTFDNISQPLNALSPMEVRFLPKSTLVSLLQSENAELLIVVTLLPIVNDMMLA